MALNDSPAGTIIATLEQRVGDDEARAQYVILMRCYYAGRVHANDLGNLRVADRAATIPAAFSELAALDWIVPSGQRIRSRANHKPTNVWELTCRGAVAARRFVEDFDSFISMEGTEARRAA